MVKEVEAVYERGVLRPLEPLALREQQRVRLTVDERPAPEKAALRSPYNDRREEMQWLATEGKGYAGQWVALSGSRLVAHDVDGARFRAAVRAAGGERPLLVHLPAEDDRPFAGLVTSA